MPQSTRPSERLLNDRQRLRAANVSLKALLCESASADDAPAALEALTEDGGAIGVVRWVPAMHVSCDARRGGVSTNHWNHNAEAAQPRTVWHPGAASILRSKHSMYEPAGSAPDARTHLQVG